MPRPMVDLNPFRAQIEVKFLSNHAISEVISWLEAEHGVVIGKAKLQGALKA